MRSNPEFSPRLLVAICWSVLAVLFSIPASAHPVYLTGEDYTWHYDVWQTWDDNWAQPTATLAAEAVPEFSMTYLQPTSGPSGGSVTVAGSYESQQQSSDQQFSFSARSSVSAEGHLDSGSVGFRNDYSSRVSQKFYYLEFLVTEEVTFLGNLALTDAFFPTTEFCSSYGGTPECPVFGEVGEVFLSGSILGPGTYRYWSGNPNSILSGFAFDGFASISGGPGTASYSSFTQFINMQFTATAVPTPSTFLLTLSGLGLALFARSRRFWSDRGGMQLVSQS